jgi:hypothetical protein
MKALLLMLALALGFACRSMAADKIDRGDLKSTLRGMIQALETRDFKTYFEYIDPSKTKNEDFDEMARQAAAHPVEMQKGINLFKLALTLEPKFDKKTGLYTFSHPDLPTDMAFVKIDGKFYATDGDRKSPAAGDSTNRTDAAAGKAKP